MKKITHIQFRTLVKAYYKQLDDKGRKIPLIAYGTFGVGKSAVILDTAMEIARKKEKEFIDWNRITKKEKDEVVANPKGKFIFIDIRLSEYDTSDIKGLPDFKGEGENISENIIWKSPFWTKLLENTDSDGILLFDELNLASPLVISSTYKILYDRVINDSKICENWLMIGCGNKDDDRAYTHELASPVRDRAGEVELTPPSVDDWIEHFAIPNEIDSRIIGFLSWKPSYLHNVDFDSGQKFTTERGWARLHTLIKNVESQDNLELVSGTAIGEGIAREFCAFCKLKDKIKLEEVIKNPDLLKTINEVDIRYFIITSVAEKYKDNKEKEVTFEKVMKISEVLDSISACDFVSLLWRLCVKYNPNKFTKDFTTKDMDNPLRKKYFKYLE